MLRAPEVFDLWHSAGPGATMQKHGYGKSADVYSWGIIAWQFVTGKSTPYEQKVLLNEGSIFGFFQSVKNGPRPSMGGIPPVMKELIEKCVHRNPSKRCRVEDIGKCLQNKDLLRPGLLIEAAESTNLLAADEKTLKMKTSALYPWFIDLNIATAAALEYSKVLEAEGFDDVGALRYTNVDELVNEHGLKKAHARKIMWHVDQLPGARV